MSKIYSSWLFPCKLLNSYFVCLEIFRKYYAPNVFPRKKIYTSDVYHQTGGKLQVIMIKIIYGATISNNDIQSKIVLFLRIFTIYLSFVMKLF